MTEIAFAVVGLLVGLGLGWWFGSRRSRSAATTAVTEGSAAETVSTPSRHDGLAGHIRRAVDDLRLGVILLDADGDELYRNQVAEQYATGRHGSAIAEAAVERVVAGARIGLSLSEDVDIYGPPVRNLEVQASPIYDQADIVGVVAVIEDVTEARHLDRVRSDFVANVSHELRTPVGAMTVLAEALSDSNDPEVTQRLTDRIQWAAVRLVDLIDDLLVLSRLESGAERKAEITDLVSIARMAIDRVAESADHRSISLELDRRHDGPILVDADQGQLVAAVGNLLENAIKYSDDGASVIMVLDLGSQPGCRGGGEEARAVLSVVDSGIGIPERDLNRIFERFYRVDSARSRETGGTGLGLAIARHAVRSHGGSVSVESVEGQGSTFTIRLPISSAQLQTEPFDADDLLTDTDTDTDTDSEINSDSGARAGGGGNSNNDEGIR